MAGLTVNNYELTRYVGSQLKWAIYEHTHDLDALCKDTGISKKLLKLYITGKRMPSLISLSNICWYLGISIDDIYDSDLFAHIKQY